MAETTYAMESLTYLAAGLVDRKEPDMMLESAIAKLFCSEGLWRITDDLVQIWGGEGYMQEHGVERMLRDARINRIVEGATEVMAAFIALVGMKGVGEEFESVLRASRHPIGNFGRLARFAHSQWSDVVTGAGASTGWNGHTRPELADECAMLASLTTRLARAVHKLLRTYRQDILDMQLLQERVAWSVVDMYAMAAVLSRLQSDLTAANGNGNGNGHAEQLKRDLIVGKGFCRRAASAVRQRLKSLNSNDDADVLAVADAVLSDSRAS